MGAMLTALHHSRNWPPCKRRQRFCQYVCTPDLGCTGGSNDIDAGTDTDFVGACTPAHRLAIAGVVRRQISLSGWGALGMVGLLICLLGRQMFGCTDRGVWTMGGSVTWEKRMFAEGPVNGGGCGPWLVFWFHLFTLATEEEHVHQSDGFWKAVDRVRSVESATFFYGQPQLPWWVPVAVG